MELSICIPIYNQNVTPLVNELRAQALRADCQFEILLMDDASTRYKEANSRLCELEGVRFIGLEKNVGRSVIRNKLADEAFYDYLLFMDCDVCRIAPIFWRNIFKWRATMWWWAVTGTRNNPYQTPIRFVGSMARSVRSVALPHETVGPTTHFQRLISLSRNPYSSRCGSMSRSKVTATRTPSSASPSKRRASR